jgi:hypothetical protein
MIHNIIDLSYISANFVSFVTSDAVTWLAIAELQLQLLKDYRKNILHMYAALCII